MFLTTFSASEPLPHEDRQMMAAKCPGLLLTLPEAVALKLGLEEKDKSHLSSQLGAHNNNC